MHRPHGGHVLLHDGFERTAARLNVPHQPPHEADVRRRIDEQFDVDALAQLGLGENQNALHDDHAPRLDALRFLSSGVRSKVVAGHFDRRSFSQHVEMTHEQLRLQRIGMVEVDLRSLLVGKSVEVAVVGIVRDPLDAIAADAVVDRLRHGRLPRTGPAGDSDDHWRLHQGGATTALLRAPTR